MGVRENKVEQYLKDEVVKLGGITRKWVSPGHSGVPDQIALIKGNIYFIEVKTVDGELSSGQAREIDRLRKHGARVFTVYGHVNVDALVKVFKKDLAHD